jgi:hypothetical protein
VFCRFTQELYDVIKDLERKVAIKLGVNPWQVGLFVDGNYICFETAVDNVYADLNIPGAYSLLEELQHFMDNEDVEWKIRD